MTQDDIIRMTVEASATGCADELTGDAIARFAQLVAAAERERYDDLFASIKNWSEAYPISVFPEPDFKKAHEVLKANGMTLDAISASNMKHVITQVQKMIDAATLGK